MWRYIFHRLLLLIPTLLGILAITFAVIQFVPGGPVEQMVQQLTQGAVAGHETICKRCADNVDGKGEDRHYA